MVHARVLKTLRLVVGIVMVVGAVAGCGSAPKATPTPSLPTAGQSGETRIINGIEMVYVPTGEFTMGNTQEEADNALQQCNEERGSCDLTWFTWWVPAHTVTVDGFWIGKYEVTNAQYQKFIDAGGYSIQKWWSEEGWKWVQNVNRKQPLFWNREEFKGDNFPVVGLTWYEADAFARWAGMRLPTEAEWEKAARGTDGRQYPWGNENDGKRLNSCDRGCAFGWKDDRWDDGYATTSPVGTFLDGASPYGALDMAGNAQEWCSDWFGEEYYKESPANNPAGPSSGKWRVWRGSGWKWYLVFNRCTYRAGIEPNLAGDTYGVRVASSVAPGS
jgi:formylglycine-generating enzyme required for sulfatase activity